MKFTVDVLDPSESGLLWLLTPVGGSPMLFKSISVVPCDLVNACVVSFCSMIEFSKFVGGTILVILLLSNLVRFTLGLNTLEI